MEKISVSQSAHPFRSFITGVLLSAGLSLFFHFGILATYYYLPVSILTMLAAVIISSLLLWVSIRYDHMIDLSDVFTKTISFDFESGQPRILRVLRGLRKINPFIGVIGTLCGLLLVLWAVPALVIYWAVHSYPIGRLLKIAVVFLCSATGIVYFLTGRDRFRSFLDKALFFTGMLLGGLAILEVLP